MNKFPVIYLFSGAGGFSKGFLDAGFDVVLGIDFDDNALKTFEKNHGQAKALKLDLYNLENIEYIVSEFNKEHKNLDVLIGGPPCQGFSLAGKRKEDDKRNVLYKAMVKLAERMKPKAIVLENVPGILTLYNGVAKKMIFDDFKKLGYKMSVKVLYAPEYGVPQIRKRAFFVGLLNTEEEFRFPDSILSSKNFITCEDAISDLPSLDGIYGDEIQEYECSPKTQYQAEMRKNSTKLYNNIATIHSEKTVKMISLVPEGKNYKSLPEEYRSMYKYNEALTRYHSKKPSLTINTGHRSHFHYKYNRIPTVRESARLQSFPDDFIFYGNKSEQYKQVGNAVPPKLGYVIAKKLKEYLYKIDNSDRKKYKFIDLFAGCGGLEDGFMQTGDYECVSSVEWLKPQVETLRERLKNKYNIWDANESVLHFDIQREEELFNGWKQDETYGSSLGLDYYVKKANGIDLIIGGPPCQAYSIAGRVRDNNGMRDDYRNYLFEHYLSVVKRYRPKVFIFENVPGILSAKPSNRKIIEIIEEEFKKIGYIISDKIQKYGVVDASKYGVPQRRKRVILLGVRNDLDDLDSIYSKIFEFYNEILPKYQKDEVTVGEAIDDLPRINPIWDEEKRTNKKAYTYEKSLDWHIPRYHNLRDMDTYRMLAEDIETENNIYTNASAITQIYEQKVGSKSPIHRYHVLRKDEPSTTIIAHLYKDGNRFIHYDSSQARSITPREAARLQSFDDDFKFIGSRGSVYQMIGNAVPPKLAFAIGKAIKEFLDKLKKGE